MNNQIQQQLKDTEFVVEANGVVRIYRCSWRLAGRSDCLERLIISFGIVRDSRTMLPPAQSIPLSRTRFFVARLRFESLEKRDCPTAFGSRDGWVMMPDNKDYIPFPDFLASHYTAHEGELTVVGAAPGGGPRVQIKDGDDFFAFENTFRGGVRVATDGEHVVAGASVGGGPVVAVFDKDGKELARFFAYDSEFRGGVSVAIKGDRILTMPADGGGPLLRQFDFHGAMLDEAFVGDVNERGPYELVVGDVTYDGIEDVSIVHKDRITVNGQLVTHSAGAANVGYLSDTFALGGGYKRSLGYWGGFDNLGVKNFINAAAGNTNPPKTTGYRPGVYHGVLPSGLPGSLIVESGVEVENFAGETVSVKERGQGTQYAAMVGPDGQEYVVTARHVVGIGGSSYPIEGIGYPTIVTPIPPVYIVDAAAAPSTNVSRGLLYEGKRYAFDGFAIPHPGDVIVAVGRENSFGVGIYSFMLHTPTEVNWGLANNPKINEQFIVGPAGSLALGEPGYSGGPAFVLTQDGRRLLIGMVVAGNGSQTIVTPNEAVEKGLGLVTVIK